MENTLDSSGNSSEPHPVDSVSKSVTSETEDDSESQRYPAGKYGVTPPLSTDDHSTGPVRSGGLNGGPIGSSDGDLAGGLAGGSDGGLDGGPAGGSAGGLSGDLAGEGDRSTAAATFSSNRDRRQEEEGLPRIASARRRRYGARPP